jgi:hypothetical protein
MDWVDTIIKETDTVIVTCRLSLVVADDDSFLIDSSPENIIGYYVECKNHQVKVAIDALQAEIVESSESFCRPCLAGSPPVIRKSSPMVQQFKDYLRHQEYVDAMDNFISGLDI